MGLAIIMLRELSMENVCSSYVVFALGNHGYCATDKEDLVLR